MYGLICILENGKLKVPDNYELDFIKAYIGFNF